MLGLLIVAYLVAEIAAFVAVAHYWSVLGAIALVIASSALGVLVVLRRTSRSIAGIGDPDRRRIGADPAADVRRVGDTALSAGAVGLLLIPGIVSGGLGVLLLIPPVRTAVRPALGVGVRRMFPGLAAMTVITSRTRIVGGRGAADPQPGSGTGDPTVIDGEIVEDPGGDDDPYPPLDR